VDPRASVRLRPVTQLVFCASPGSWRSQPSPAAGPTATLTTSTFRTPFVARLKRRRSPSTGERLHRDDSTLRAKQPQHGPDIAARVRTDIDEDRVRSEVLLQIASLLPIPATGHEQERRFRDVAARLQPEALASVLDIDRIRLYCPRHSTSYAATVDAATGSGFARSMPSTFTDRMSRKPENLVFRWHRNTPSQSLYRSALRD
jgi:hypothetical protein